jgi:hypothetical protein
VASGDESSTTTLVLVVDGVPDLAVVDALARIRLAADRLGWRVRIDGAREELLGLLGFVGLTCLVAEDG